MNDLLTDKLEQIKANLHYLFPDANTALLFYYDSYCYDYNLSVFDSKKQRLGYLKFRFYGEGSIFQIQLFKDNYYQVNKNKTRNGFDWFVSHKYKMPENHHEIERILADIWTIFI